jgi:hypothetical protein
VCTRQNFAHLYPFPYADDGTADVLYLRKCKGIAEATLALYELAFIY